MIPATRTFFRCGPGERHGSRLRGRGRVSSLATIVGLAVLAAAPSSPAFALWTGSTAYGECVKAAGGVDPAVADCAVAEAGRQDKRLNAAYVARLEKADPPLKVAVKASQRAWITYRDTTCAAEGALYDGGTLQRVVEPECRARLTSERADWLTGLEP